MIKSEYHRIDRETNNKPGYTAETVEGYNDSDKGRAFKLWDTGKLVTKRGLPDRARNIVNAPKFPDSRYNESLKRVLEGTQRWIVRDAKAHGYIGLSTEEQKVVSLKEEKLGLSGEFTMKLRGLLHIEKLEC